MFNSRLKKRVLIVFTAVIMLLMSACGSGVDSSKDTSGAQASTAPAVEVAKDPFGKYDTTITIKAARKSRPNIKFIAGEDYTNNVVSKEYKEKLNIDVQYDWIVDEAQYEQKVNLSIAANAIPDTLQVTATQEQQLMDAGLIYDLTDTFNQYASPLLKNIVQGDPQLLKTVLVDGKLYDIPMMPSKDFNMNVLQIRKDWLDNVGLAAPKTADELWAVMDAFVNKDPDKNGKKDTIGLSFNKDLTASVGVGDIGPMFAMYKAYPLAWIKDASGNLVYGSVQPEMKAALQKMQDLYKAGLIDQEFTVKDQGKVAQDMVGEKLGIDFGVFWSPAYPWNDVKIKNKNLDLINLDIPSVDGSPVLSTIQLTPLLKLVVNKDCKNPEAIVKMVNLGEELFWGTGELGKYWQTVGQDPKYKEVAGGFNNYPLMMMEPPTLNYDLVKEVTDGVNAKDPNLGLTTEGKTEIINSLKYLNDGDMAQWGIWALRVGPGSATAISNARQDAHSYIVSEFYGSPGPVQTEKSSTLLKMEQEMITKIIMNAAPVSDFDKFVASWKTSGGDALTTEINGWYAKNK